MAIFYVLLLVPMLIQHIAIKSYRIDYQKRNQKALEFFFFLLTLMVMLRHERVGNDTGNYVYYFKEISRLEWRHLGGKDLELGFLVFCKAVSMLFDNPQVFFAIIAIAVTAMIYPTYKRLCIDASLTIVLFCTMSTFVMMFSGIRQMIAIGIGFIAYEYTREKKKVHFSAAVILAMLFHVSAFMLLFMYPLYHAKITRKWLYVIVPVQAVFFLLNKPIFSILTIFLARFTRFEAELSSTGAYTMLILFAAFAVFAFLIPKESVLDAEIVGLRNFLLFSVMLQMFAPLHMLAMRLNYYYIIFIPLLIPKIIQYRSKRWNQVALLGRNVMVVFFLVYFFWNATREGNLNVFPYHFFWETV